MGWTMLLLELTTLCLLLSDPGPALVACLPASVDGWTPNRPDGLYTADGLFKYIDGSAEVYRSYNVQQVAARRYGKEGAPDIIADVFDMGRAADAFGAYHHDYREGESVELGRESEYLEGALAFWKDRYFVSVLTIEETPESKAAVLKTAQAIAAAIKDDGAPPDIVALLPAEGLQTRHVHYFHDHFCLNIHYFLAEDNLLDLGKDTEGVMGRYVPDAAQPKAACWLTIVRYPGAARSETARAKFMAGYLPEAGGDAFAAIENGKWAGARISGDYVVAVFDAPSRAFAEKLAGQALAAIDKRRQTP